jgi:hypothetical protein
MDRTKPVGLICDRTFCVAKDCYVILICSNIRPYILVYILRFYKYHISSIGA